MNHSSAPDADCKPCPVTGDHTQLQQMKDRTRKGWKDPKKNCYKWGQQSPRKVLSKQEEQFDKKQKNEEENHRWRGAEKWKIKEGRKKRCEKGQHSRKQQRKRQGEHRTENRVRPRVTWVIIPLNFTRSCFTTDPGVGPTSRALPHTFNKLRVLRCVCSVYVCVIHSKTIGDGIQDSNKSKVNLTKVNQR